MFTCKKRAASELEADLFLQKGAGCMCYTIRHTTGPSFHARPIGDWEPSGLLRRAGLHEEARNVVSSAS